jgi:predicted DNA-binding WGR domain protein
MNRWIHPEKGRYYQAELVQDLFGDWTLILVWGGFGSRRGQVRVVYVASFAAGLERLESLAKRRRQRGYRERLSQGQGA